MSYHIYTTKGIVLSERPVREADRLYSILTKDLGLIRARALGVRKEASKLRGLVEPFALATVSLVRGKEYWRLTSAELILRLPADLRLARPLALLEKLVQGEAAHPELFEAIENHVENHMINHTEEESALSESQLVARILFHLGYLDETDLKLKGRNLVKAINDGLQASHLY